MYHADPRVVGGSKVKPDNPVDLHFIASLQRGQRHVCGASLIHPNWLLTANHCVKEGYSPVTAVTGSYDLTQALARSAVDVFRPSGASSSQNDIALLRLEKPVLGVEPIAIKPAPRVGSKVEVAGWGATQFLGDMVTDLRKADVDVLSHADCSKYSIGPGHVCAGLQRGGKDACQGDSGGPLYSKSRELVGVVSYGKDCAKKGWPGVYTNVHHYLPWIQSTMAEFGDSLGGVPGEGGETGTTTPPGGGASALDRFEKKPAGAPKCGNKFARKYKKKSLRLEECAEKALQEAAAFTFRDKTCFVFEKECEKSRRVDRKEDYREPVGGRDTTEAPAQPQPAIERYERLPLRTPICKSRGATRHRGLSLEKCAEQAVQSESAFNFRGGTCFVFEDHECRKNQRVGKKDRYYDLLGRANVGFADVGAADDDDDDGEGPAGRWVIYAVAGLVAIAGIAFVVASMRQTPRTKEKTRT